MSITTNNAQFASKSAESLHMQHGSSVFPTFVWGAGVECSFLQHIDVDQFEWTQHNRFWKEDFDRAANVLGAKYLRYAFPWHLIEAKRGEFDWTMPDERIAYCKKLGIELLVDVMHFGTPTWLEQAVGDPRFPEALESFTEAIVTRYRADVKVWCPFNEPLVSALFSGDFGFWPPFARKWRGYMPVLSRVVQAVSRSIAAIRRAAPEATVLLCDAVEHFQTRVPDLQSECDHRNLRRYIVSDLLTGRVDSNHALYSWITSFGLSELDLDWFRRHPQTPDVMGLDYYPHSDWQLDRDRATNAIRQRRADTPLGLLGIARQVYNRYGLPMMVTETSVDGPSIGREIWLEQIVDQIRELREEGVPMLGLIWWPLLDQIDWDGALRHRIGKLHEVGLFKLQRIADGTLTRTETPLVKQFRKLIESGEQSVGKLENLSTPAEDQDPQLPPLSGNASEWKMPGTVGSNQSSTAKSNDNGHGTNGNGHENAESVSWRDSESAVGLAGEPQLVAKLQASTGISSRTAAETRKNIDRYGIVVFSHLRWGFVWQRPQQFLSRFARKHSILFVEEPFFDLAEGAEARLEMHRVMPNVTVACPHCPGSMNGDPTLPARLREWTREAIESVNGKGEFDNPLHWYYSPMDAAWSLGHFTNRGVVYDCMDELSMFTGAPKSLVQNEARLMEHADIVFTGGYELWLSKSKQHSNAHFFGCGVEFEHFSKAQDATTPIPPDIDFIDRPILGWFGVVDERVDYGLVADMARIRKDFSFVMVGPVVKVDPNLLPHAPNIHWLGGRDYQQLPNYCRAFDVNMMCFALNASTQFINPTKALEYLATGKPVVSTPVRDVVRQYTDVVDIASTADEFVNAAARALREPNRGRINAGIELARANSWEGTVATMQNLIKESIAKRQERKQAAPLPEGELQYQYAPTQGS